MIESTHHTHHLNDLNIKKMPSITSMFFRICLVLSFLVSREDTAKSMNTYTMHTFEENRISGAIKTIFWIAVSIGAGILFGQLS